MTLGELRNIWRLELMDAVTPYLWSDAEFANFLNAAQIEAVRRGWSIVDSTTTDICELTYAANESVLTLDPRILVIKRALVSGQIIPLLEMVSQRMDLVWPGWLGHTAPHPTMYIKDRDSQSIRLYPIPTEAGVVNLTVAREPLYALEGDSDEPEIPLRHQRSLLHWCKHLAYQKHDVEVFDQQASLQAAQQFAAEFGERRSARSERWQEEQAGLMTDTLA